MKAILFFTLLIFISTSLFSQVTRYTPKGTQVTATDYLSIYGAYNSTDIAYWDNHWLSKPGVDASKVTLLAHSSTGYNCHSYAWHVSEGGDTVWMDDITEINGNYYDIDNVNKYWDDGSYVETTQANHRKVFYHPETQFDHSAVTTSQTNWFISKWTNGPLVKHKYDNCPYWDSDVNLTYYKLSNPAISSTTSGPLCDNVQRTYSETAFTDIDLDYDWNYTSPLDEVGDDDESTYTVEGTPQNGQGTVSLTITTPSGATATASKNVWVGAPQLIGISGPTYGPIGQMQTYSVQLQSNLSSPTDYVWMITPSGGATITDWGNYCWVTFNSPGTYQLLAHAINDCNWSAPAMLYINASGGMFMSISPNPTSGEATVSIESNSEETTFDENAEWDLEVYSPTQSLKQKKTKLKGKSTKIQTHGWKEGVYMVRVKYKDEVLTGKLIVKK